jgi:hypothetical protein
MTWRFRDTANRNVVEKIDSIAKTSADAQESLVCTICKRRRTFRQTVCRQYIKTSWPWHLTFGFNNNSKLRTHSSQLAILIVRCDFIGQDIGN